MFAIRQNGRVIWTGNVRATMLRLNKTRTFAGVPGRIVFGEFVALWS